MDTPSTNQSEQVGDREGVAPDVGEGNSSTAVDTKAPKSTEKALKTKSKKQKDAQKKAGKSKAMKAKEVVPSDTEDSDTLSDLDSGDNDSLSSDSDEDSETETEKEKKKRKAKKKAKQKAKDKRKAKSKKKARKEAATESDTGSDSDSESEEETDSELEDEVAPDAEIQRQLLQMQQMQQLQGLGQGGLQPNWGNLGGAGRRAQLGGNAHARLQVANAKQLAALGLDPNGLKKGKKDKRGKKKRASKLEFKRVDQLWDSTIHNYKLTDTAEDEESSEYDQYLFNVRRTFDWEGKYKVCPLVFCTLDDH
jgi:hypothetical protein